MVTGVIAAATLAIWAYLLGARGMFWLCAQRDRDDPVAPNSWPDVVAVIPARNEADSVGESIGSLLCQDYPGRFTVILVDDDSVDATAAIAERAAAAPVRKHSLIVVRSRGLPAGWTGKLWAIKQGIAAAETMPVPPRYLLLTDADIVHAPDTLRWLVAQAQAGGYGLTSLMAKLRCESLPERIHVPAFIFFFQMLFPFSWVNDRRAATAAAAGGCMLVHADILRQAGGIEIIRSALIDDCALAEKLKQWGPIWLGLTDRVRSIRSYRRWDNARRMVSRSAYAQLRYSPLLLLATTIGMALTYLAPPLLTLLAAGPARLFALLTWTLMALTFQPTLRFYRMSPLWGLALPAIAFLYMVYTLDSAYQYARGRGGSWKGRIQANMSAR